MNKVKKILIVLLAMSVVFAITACQKSNSGDSDAGGGSTDDTYKIKIALENSDTYPATLGLKAMKKYVEKHTDGHVEITIAASGQLGGEEETLEQTTEGNLEMCVASFAPVTTFAPDFELMDIPFIYNTYPEAWAVLDSSVGTDLLASMEKHGLKGLAYMENGFRQVTSSVKPIETMNDFNGLKIRTMQNNTHMAFFKAMGANPTPVPFSELYTSLSQKVVDAQENPIANVTDKKLYEVQKYLSLTRHLYDAMPLVCNLDYFNSLPVEYQAVIQAGAIYGQEVSRFINEEREELILKDLKKQGMKVNTPSESAREEMAKEAQPAAIKKVAKDIGKDKVDKYRKDVDKILAQISDY